MKKAGRIVLGMGIAVAIAGASSASADLVGLRVFREQPGGAGPPPPGPERWIYRVYAEFTSPTDMVGTWGTGDAGFGFGGVWNIAQNGLPGSGFTNVPNDVTSNTAPVAPGTFADWDTFMTIGVLYADQGPGNMDYTITFFNTQLFIANGTSAWTYGGAALFLNIQQGYANYRVSGNDTDKRVLLMQLVVNAGEHVHGKIGISWRSDGGEFVTTPDLQFNSLPAPGAFYLLFVLALRRERRRDCHGTPGHVCPRR